MHSLHNGPQEAGRLPFKNLSLKSPRIVILIFFGFIEEKSNLYSHLSCFCDKPPNKSDLKTEGRGSLGSQFEGTVHPGRKRWQREREVTDHVASAARKWGEMNAGAHLAFTLLLNPRPSLWDDAAQR